MSTPLSVGERELRLSNAGLTILLHLQHRHYSIARNIIFSRKNKEALSNSMKGSKLMDALALSPIDTLLTPSPKSVSQSRPPMRAACMHTVHVMHK